MNDEIEIIYPTFDEVKDATLRAWNRLNIIFNIKEFVGNAVATKYAAQFDKGDKIAIMLLATNITHKGYENTRREIFREEYA